MVGGKCWPETGTRSTGIATSWTVFILYCGHSRLVLYSRLLELSSGPVLSSSDHRHHASDAHYINSEDRLSWQSATPVTCLKRRRRHIKYEYDLEAPGRRLGRSAATHVQHSLTGRRRRVEGNCIPARASSRRGPTRRSTNITARSITLLRRAPSRALTGGAAEELATGDDAVFASCVGAEIWK